MPCPFSYDRFSTNRLYWLYQARVLEVGMNGTNAPLPFCVSSSACSFRVRGRTRQLCATNLFRRGSVPCDFVFHCLVPFSLHAKRRTPRWCFEQHAFRVDSRPGKIRRTLSARSWMRGCRSSRADVSEFALCATPYLRFRRGTPRDDTFFDSLRQPSYNRTCFFITVVVW